ncbi:hypothetical protein [Natrialba sp. SSL1]|uniref:hypothetical protein n=1 Tax=Natrialba sp. SSL1 TaxID=1869245 RepID=UPI0008F91C0A|nr:hypothetical protein [Natrialba sp. SSL1]OIB56613.1 hypothetical protein BBD46_16625 [Natrialba sp. SSL1]
MNQLPTIDDVDEDELIGEDLENVPKISADSKCRAKKTEGPTDEKVFAGYCRARAGKGTDAGPGDGRRCKTHGGDNSGDKGQGGTEGNDNAVDHGGYRKHFTRHLTDGEQEAFDEARRALGDPKDAKQVAQTAAGLCLIQFDRTGDERFMRRYESICDKAGIFPNEEIDVNHGGSIDLWKSSAEGDSE